MCQSGAYTSITDAQLRFSEEVGLLVVSSQICREICDWGFFVSINQFGWPLSLTDTASNRPC